MGTKYVTLIVRGYKTFEQESDILKLDDLTIKGEAVTIDLTLQCRGMLLEG